MKRQSQNAHDEYVCLSVRVCLYELYGVIIVKYTGTLTAQHVIVCIVCDGVDVWRRLRAPFAFVGCDHRGCVDWQPFVWIQRHTEESGVGLRKQDMMQY